MDGAVSPQKEAKIAWKTDVFVHWIRDTFIRSQGDKLRPETDEEAEARASCTQHRKEKPMSNQQEVKVALMDYSAARSVSAGQ